MARLLRPALLLAALALSAGAAAAQSSLGIGAAEPAIQPGGPLAGLLAWVNAQQQDFYRALTGALKAMRDGEGAVWPLVALSFAYGVFHAAGPGHGKAVISSYMLANEVALRRGIVLSVVSAMLQAVTAILVMAAVFLALRGTAISATDATRFLETASFALVAAFGGWLLWRKLGAAVRPAMPLRSLSAAHAGAVPAAGRHDRHHHHDDRHHAHDGHHGHPHHDHAPGAACASCGHAHAPDPARLAGDRLDWRTAWSAVAAVGLRPCSGALIVLTFAFLNGLWAGGIASVFAMAAGTAITVAVLASLAVTAKNWAVAVAGGGTLGRRIHAGIEIAGALFILLLGLTLLAASLAA